MINKGPNSNFKNFFRSLGGGDPMFGGGDIPGLPPFCMNPCEVKSTIPSTPEHSKVSVQQSP